MDQKKFCAVPWNELYITSNGTYGLCCMEDQNQNTRRVPINQEIQQHWNSDYVKDARRSFVEGQQLEQCRHCWKDEEAGKVSGRMRRNQQYYGKADINIEDPVIEKTLAMTSADGYTEAPVTGLVLSVGNLCQLRCIDCAPSYSRSILKDYEKLGWDPNTKNRRIIMQQDMLHDKKQHDISLWQRVREVGNSIRWIRVTGGEPTLSKDFLSFLRWYSDQGHAERTTIFIATNCVNVKDDFIDALKPFQGVKLELSVDGVGALDEYLRYPTNWSKKVDIMDRLIETFPGCVVHTTVYSLNVEGLEKLIPWVETKDVLHSIQCLTYPDELAVQHLPDEYKQQMIDALSLWLPDQNYVVSDKYDRTAYRNNAVLGVINRLKQDRDPSQWERSREIIRAYDTIRPNKLGDLIPGILPYL